MAFLDTTLVALRESLEALLILGILLGIAVKTGQAGARRPLLWGAFAAVGVSLLVGSAVSKATTEAYEANELLFEASAALIAVAILTYMIVWMYRHTQGMMGALHKKTKEALALGRPGLLFGIAFVAVLREGIETVLFVSGKVPTDGIAMTAVALLVGIAISALIAFLIFSGFLKLSIERFMAGTGLVLVVIAAGLLGYGAHEGAEYLADEHGNPVLEDIPKAYDLSSWLPHKAYKDQPDGSRGPVDTPREAVGSFLHGLVVYRADPTWLEVGLWVAYVGGMGGWVISKLRKGGQHATPPDAPERNRLEA